MLQSFSRCKKNPNGYPLFSTTDGNKGCKVKRSPQHENTSQEILIYISLFFSQQMFHIKIYNTYAT